VSIRWREGMTWRALRWWLIPVVAVVAIFVSVWGLSGFTTAFELLTGTASVSQVRADTLGWLLSFSGYLLIPIAVGVVATAVFAGQVRTMTPQEFEDRADRWYREAFGESPPSRVR
jgi:hypothetical protein